MSANPGVLVSRRNHVLVAAATTPGVADAAALGASAIVKSQLLSSLCAVLTTPVTRTRACAGVELLGSRRSGALGRRHALVRHRQGDSR